MQLHQQSQYESLSFLDPHFPVIFHHDIQRTDQTPYMLHWHDAIEVLLLTHGECHVIYDDTPFRAKEGDIVVLGSNCLHTFYAISPVCEYDCLIVDSGFLERFGLPVSMKYERLFHSSGAVSYFQKVKGELGRQSEFYKQAVSALVLEFFVCLARDHAFSGEPASLASGNKLDMIKGVITYIQANYKKPLTVDDICCRAGFSKYYLSRSFKEITGYTLMEYVTITRCRQARQLLLTGSVTVSQAAALCQFNHLSHFSKTYKKYMGVLPRTVKGEAAKSVPMF